MQCRSSPSFFGPRNRKLAAPGTRESQWTYTGRWSRSSDVTRTRVRQRHRTGCALFAGAIFFQTVLVSERADFDISASPNTTLVRPSPSPRKKVKPWASTTSRNRCCKSTRPATNTVLTASELSVTKIRWVPRKREWISLVCDKNEFRKGQVYDN